MSLISVYFKNDYQELTNLTQDSEKIIEEFSINIINKEDKSDFQEKYNNYFLLVFRNLNVAKCYSQDQTVKMIGNIINDMTKYNIDCVELGTIVDTYELGNIRSTVFSCNESDVYLVKGSSLFKTDQKRFYSKNLFL